MQSQSLPLSVLCYRCKRPPLDRVDYASGTTVSVYADKVFPSTAPEILIKQSGVVWDEDGIPVVFRWVCFDCLTPEEHLGEAEDAEDMRREMFEEQGVDPDQAAAEEDWNTEHGAPKGGAQ